MAKPKTILERCTGFEWDAGNETKNRDKHEVSKGECEQVFFNMPLIVKRDKNHSVFQNKYYALGRTDGKRYLFTVSTIRNDKIRVISSRDMTKREIERYMK